MFLTERSPKLELMPTIQDMAMHGSREMAERYELLLLLRKKSV